MSKIWRNRIEAGDQLFKNCPEKYRKDVLNFMRADVKKEIITAEKFEELTGIPYEE